VAEELAKTTAVGIDGRSSLFVSHELIIDLCERMMLTDSLPDFAAANGGVYGEVEVGLRPGVHALRLNLSGGQRRSATRRNANP
jgi:hypothetical protein